ncbi:AlbA family DNA-binding domain-containing protein [Kitasatospora fiedleri]|uniref:AlbA family DNA-binding domain-containing protein n=1 Tax=Kitasatospora fiedleri TaxID=2991545 RepID=UPI00249C3818|nr:ATP-binding protein [Kitasatospora fiedleri]
MFDLRLRTLLGVHRLQDATWEQLLSLKDNENAAEGPDIDYKAGPVPYGRGTEGAGEFVKDVLALANTSGGVLVLGMAEDRTTSIPTVPVPVQLTDQARKQYNEYLAQRAEPNVECVIHFVPKEPGGTEGIMLVAVPPSAHAPHAVIGTRDLRDGTLRYPWRNDNQVAFMNPTRVKSTIMASMTATAARQDVLRGAEHDIRNAAYLGYPIMSVTLIPDIPGSFSVNKASLEDFAQETKGPFIWNGADLLPHTSVGPRRLTASDAEMKGRHIVHLHSDGSGAWGSKVRLAHILDRFDDEATDSVPCWDSRRIAEAALEKTWYLARHAVDRAGAAGTATLQITLFCAPAERMPLGGGSHPVTLGPHAHSDVTGSASILLDNVVEGGRDLVAGTAAALADLYQHFGLLKPRRSRWTARSSPRSGPSTNGYTSKGGQLQRASRPSDRVRRRSTPRLPNVSTGLVRPKIPSTVSPR